MKIAVDAAGGDYAPHEMVKGAIKAAQEYGVEVVLVGRRNVLHKLAEKSFIGLALLALSLCLSYASAEPGKSMTRKGSFEIEKVRDLPSNSSYFPDLN